MMCVAKRNFSFGCALTLSVGLAPVVSASASRTSGRWATSSAVSGITPYFGSREGFGPATREVMRSLARGKKHQIPISKHQGSTKFQTPNYLTTSGVILLRGAWLFLGVWDLGFGISGGESAA